MILANLNRRLYKGSHVVDSDVLRKCSSVILSIINVVLFTTPNALWIKTNSNLNLISY